MGRLLLCLPLCLILQDVRAVREAEPPASHDYSISGPLPRVALQGPARIASDLAAGLAAAGPLGFPAGLSWGGVVCEHGKALLLDIAIHRPVDFLQMCLDRYDREVQGYVCIMRKRELINGQLRPWEKNEAHFRERPFSVHLTWLQGARLGGPSKVLYVEGENDGKLLARPYGIGPLSGVVTREVEGPDAKNSGRYTIKQFGIRLGTQRTLDTMRKAKVRDALHVRYLGMEVVPEVGDRLCYRFIRTPYEPPEEEGLNELTIYIDVETWLQVGSELRDAEGKVIADYYFRDIKINPTFRANQFTKSVL